MTLPDEPEPADVTLLDTAQAEIGAGLRALFDPVLQEKLPANLAVLAETLEDRLDAGGEKHPDPVTPSAVLPSSLARDA